MFVLTLKKCQSVNDLAHLIKIIIKFNEFLHSNVKVFNFAKDFIIKVEENPMEKLLDQTFL